MPARCGLAWRIYGVEQQRRGTLPHLEEGLPYGRERGSHKGGRCGVVETDERHVLWHAKPRLLGCHEHARGHVVTGGEDGGWTLGEREELMGTCDAPGDQKVALNHQLGI